MSKKRPNRRQRKQNTKDSKDPFVDFMKKNSFAQNTSFDDDESGHVHPLSIRFGGSRMSAPHLMMSRFGGLPMQGMDNDSNVSYSQSFSSYSVSTNNGQHAKSVHSNTMRNANGDIISECKGFERNNDGLRKMAAQRRFNDKYHFVGQQQRNLSQPIEKEQRLIGIADEPEDIQRFHRSFNEQKRRATHPRIRDKHFKYSSNHKKLKK